MKPRVLILSGFIERKQAGAAQAVIHLVNALAKRYPGEIAVAAFEHDPELLHPGVRVFPLEMRDAPRFFWRFWPFIFLRQCNRAFRAAKLPAAELCYTPNTAMALAYRRIHPSVPIVTHTGAVLADRELREESDGAPIRRWINANLVGYYERQSYRQPHWRHVVSTKLVADQREEYFGLPKGFFTIAPYGLDIARFDGQASHENMRARYGIPDDVFLVVSVARLVQWKNHDMLLHAIAQSEEKAWLFIVGAGPEDARLEALSRQLGIEDRVRFVGHADPVPFLASSDLFVLPSKIESFGLAYAEAMSMGLPCIGLRNRPPEVLSSAEDVIPEGQAGYCVDGVDDLRQRIDELARSPDTLRKLSTFAQRLATSEYTTERYVESLEAVAGGL
jgi:glycosyltransferase involved in cell wall biosynthesis